MKMLVLLPLLLAAAPAPEPAAKPALAPSEIVAAAPAKDWAAIAPADLIVMELAADAKGKSRRVVIQLMSAPFSQGWVGNIRKLVAARWYDGVSVNRVQDNYVVQWGDASEKKPLPDGLAAVLESDYSTDAGKTITAMGGAEETFRTHLTSDPYGLSGFVFGWPIGVTSAITKDGDIAADFGLPQSKGFAPIHCYGMVGVGRGMSPDTGSGAELYTVIGHAPRHLDRNIALVGRVIEGIEHLSSLQRGTGALGFYESAAERVPILSVRMGNDVAGLPIYQYLSTESASFAAYAEARANRRDPFFVKAAGGADICNIPVPVRRAK